MKRKLKAMKSDIFKNIALTGTHTRVGDIALLSLPGDAVCGGFNIYRLWT